MEEPAVHEWNKVEPDSRRGQSWRPPCPGVSRKEAWGTEIRTRLSAQMARLGTLWAVAGQGDPRKSWVHRGA